MTLVGTYPDDVDWGAPGVDPTPAVEGPAAANVFYRTTSDEFFGGGFPLRHYDIVFIDGRPSTVFHGNSTALYLDDENSGRPNDHKVALAPLLSRGPVR